MKIIKPRIYFQSEKRRPVKQYIKNKKSGIYLSSIDGKIIVNGERKDVPDINDNMCRKSYNFSPINNNINNFNNFGFTSSTFNCNYSLNRGRNYSIDRMKRNDIDIDNIPVYRVRRINKYNKDYFKDELEKMNNLLFSKNDNSWFTKSNYRINNKFY